MKHIDTNYYMNIDITATMADTCNYLQMKHIDANYHMNISDPNASNNWWMPQQNNLIS